MATDYAAILFPNRYGFRFGYYVNVVQGTIEQYYPSNRIQYWRPTAKWAKARGDRKIRTLHRKENRYSAKQSRARKVTGYGD